MNWSPDNCASCHLQNTCKHCIHIVGIKVDLRTLIKYTILPELWTIFLRITALSPTTDAGFSLASADTYFKGIPERNPFKEDKSIYGLVTHEQFWYVMMYFLKRMNDKFRAKRALELEKLKNKK